MTIKSRFEFGQKVKDKHTQFVGAVVGITLFEYGCLRISVLPETLKDGKPQGTEWIDEQRLDAVSGQGSEETSAEAGGPSPYSNPTY